MTNAILPILIPILTAVLGSYSTYYFLTKSKKNEAILRFKQEKYSKLLLFLQGFVGDTVSGELKRKFFEEQHQSWFYCSDEVVTAINEMIQLIVDANPRAPESSKGKIAIGKIVLAMRRDLLGKTNLVADDFIIYGVGNR